MTLDENDLRAGLHALTASPPPAPADRAAVSVRRLRTQRRRRTGFAVATAFAVALPLVAVVTRGPEQVTEHVVAQEPLATALLEWPTRYGEGSREFGQYAVDYESRSKDPGAVRLLYAGRVGDFEVAVVARCGATACREVNLMYHDLGQKGSELVEGGRLAPAAKAQPIGWYFPADGGSRLFVLGPPESRRLRGDGIDVTDGEGVFETRIGWRESYLDVRVLDGESGIVASGRPGLPSVDPVDAVPYAEPPVTPARVPDGYRAGPVYTRQVGTNRGEFHEAFAERGVTGPYRVFAVCRGPAKEVTVLTHTVISGKVPCDGRVHAGPLDEFERPGASFDVYAEDPFVTYSVAVGYPED
ncbi:MAG TPA: hypothetical protein VNQ77_12145 [Frankiaceae bacterium]|nr:hypothetical protein [Frankiaceae bacterium]